MQRTLNEGAGIMRGVLGGCGWVWVGVGVGAGGGAGAGAGVSVRGCGCGCGWVRVFVTGCMVDECA